MIANKRARVAEELWRDYPVKVYWRVHPSGDMEMRNGLTHVWQAWFDAKRRRWCSWEAQMGGMLEEVRRRALESFYNALALS